MNTESLKVGMIIKNHKELCDILGVKAKTSGTSKQSQIKDFQRYFKYNKQGNKYCIEEIYDIPLEKEDGRIGNEGNSIGYIDYIEVLILDLLVQAKEMGKLFLSKTKLLEELKMVNPNYRYCKRNTLKLSDFINVNINNIYEWYMLTGDTLERNIESTLKRLEKKKLIKWSKEQTVCVDKDEDKQPNFRLIKNYIGTDEYGDDIYKYQKIRDTNLVCRQATDPEVDLILAVERSSILELRCNDEQDLIRKGLWHEYLELVENKLESTHIAFYFESYKINWNKKYIIQEFKRVEKLLLDAEMKINMHTSLHNEFADRVIHNAEKRNIKAKELTDIDTSKEKYIRRSEDEYVDDYKKITDTLTELEHSSKYVNVKEGFKKMTS